MTFQHTSTRGAALREDLDASLPQYRPRPGGAFAHIRSAVLSWWQRPVRPPTVPQHLRSDLGLAPEHDTQGWWDIPPPTGSRRIDHE